MVHMISPKGGIAISTVACATLLSFGWSEQGGVSLSVESAQARIGRPLTPLSGAGVVRRHTRRAAYGAGVVGAGLAGAAVAGTAVAAANAPYYGRPGYSPGYYGTAGYYQGGPYYGRIGARPYYRGGAYAAYAAQPASPPAQNWDIVRAYHAQGPWYGYSGWDDYKTRNGLACTPGGLFKGENGIEYRCQ